MPASRTSFSRSKSSLKVLLEAFADAQRAAAAAHKRYPFAEW